MDLEIFRVIDGQSKKMEKEFADAYEKLRAENSQKDAKISRLESLLLSAGIPLDESLT